MTTPRLQKPFTCTTCGVDIAGRPVFHVGLPFCCGGCAADGPCTCSYDDDIADAAAVRHCLDIAAAVGRPTFRKPNDAVLARR